MKPTTIKERSNDALLEEDAVNNGEDGMTDEEIKIESLKIATNICKLMNDVLPEDIINVAEKVALFIKNGGELSVTSDSSDDFIDDDESDETSDFEEDFSTDDEESKDEEEDNKDTEDEETEEDFEV